MAEMNWKDIFSKASSGDKEAFAQLYNELKRPVFTVICRIVQSKELAEDVTQDVFVKLFISPPDSSVHNPRAWVFRMARNAAIDALRTKQCIHPDDVSFVAEDEIGNSIQRWDIESAISRLPCDERDILVLRLNADLPFREIAPIVGLSLPATYRKYRKAIKTLRELLDGGVL